MIKIKNVKRYSTEEIDILMKNIYREHDTDHDIEEFRQVVLPWYTEEPEQLPFIVSSYGRVFSMNYKKKKGYIHELKFNIVKKYLVAPINFNGIKRQVKVHRIVAFAFIDNPDKINKCEVNHKNGIKTDNHYWNLEWCTNKENIIHAHKTGLTNPSHKYIESQIIKVCKLLESNESLVDIVRETNVSYATVTSILYRRVWTHISKHYNFDNYGYGKSNNYQDQIHTVCKLGEIETMKIYEISRITGLSRYVIHDILYGKTHKNISSQYNLTRFQINQ